MLKTFFVPWSLYEQIAGRDTILDGWDTILDGWGGGEFIDLLHTVKNTALFKRIFNNLTRTNDILKTYNYFLIQKQF